MESGSKESHSGLCGTRDSGLIQFSHPPSAYGLLARVSLAEVMAPLRKLVHLINGEYLLAHCQVLPLIKLPHFELSLEERCGGN